MSTPATSTRVPEIKVSRASRTGERWRSADDRGVWTQVQASSVMNAASRHGLNGMSGTSQCTFDVMADGQQKAKGKGNVSH